MGDVKRALRKPDLMRVTPQMCEQAEKLCKLGLSDAELGEFFNVPEKTVARWYLDSLQFRQCVDEGRLFQNARVADAMYQRALGYDYEEEKVHIIEGAVHRVKVARHAPPDVAAQARILESRRPQDWGRKEVRELTGPAGKPLVAPTVRPEDLSKEELELFRLMLEKRIAAAGNPQQGLPAPGEKEINP